MPDSKTYALQNSRDSVISLFLMPNVRVPNGTHLTFVERMNILWSGQLRLAWPKSLSESKHREKVMFRGNHDILEQKLKCKEMTVPLLCHKVGSEEKSGIDFTSAHLQFLKSSSQFPFPSPSVHRWFLQPEPLFLPLCYWSWEKA